MNEEVDTSPPICPYCGGLLEKRPTRKTRCSFCAETILVKYTPTDRIKRLVTVARAAEIDVVWRRYHDQQAQIGLDKKAAWYGLRAGLKNDQFIAELTAIVRDHNQPIERRRQAASEISRSVNDDDRRRWSVIFHRLDLEYHLSHGHAKVSIRGGLDPCPSCAAAVGQTFDIESIRLRRPVPNQDCIWWKYDGRCCAFWAPVVSF